MVNYLNMYMNTNKMKWTLYNASDSRIYYSNGSLLRKLLQEGDAGKLVAVEVSSVECVMETGLANPITIAGAHHLFQSRISWSQALRACLLL